MLSKKTKEWGKCCFDDFSLIFRIWSEFGGVSNEHRTLILNTKVIIRHLFLKETMQGKTVVVVGGTSGMGFATAEKALKQGANVIILGRSQEKVQKAKERLGSNAQVRTRNERLYE
jgi:NADPH:quinone reductase-like Zn-dependent oxidoreductase